MKRRIKTVATSQAAVLALCDLIDALLDSPRMTGYLAEPMIRRAVAAQREAAS